jgi:methionyl aminopeptidase
VLREGMAFTIEPMLVEGSAEVGLWPDGWAVVTADGGRAAQFEHTLLVTAHGVDVLTLYEDKP